MSSQTEPRLSIVFAATHDSPALHTAVTRHLEQLAQVDGELLVADGSPDGLPEEIPVAVQIPGADVFELRAAAVGIARGWLVAITEDHCVPEPDWYSAMLRAHEEHLLSTTSPRTVTAHSPAPMSPCTMRSAMASRGFAIRLAAA